MSKPLAMLTLETAHRLVANPATWTSAALARDDFGTACEPWAQAATRFCAFGALLAAAYQLTRGRDEATRIAGIAAEVLTE